ncbi:MAG: hypothetical protein LKF48_07555 [Prevotella sp.]|jgi:hypothetical protein|nr:hypothetical protein [Prevotella sp.]MCH4182995.1 hypothetical protein [Prevotella sp.]
MVRKESSDGTFFWICPRCQRTIARSDAAENPDPEFDMTGVNVEVIENETTQN